MDAQQFLAEFGHIANAPGGVARLREMILSLAMRGEIVPQSTSVRSTDDQTRFLIDTRKKAQTKANFRTLLAVDEAEIPYVLPVNWIWTRLGEVVEVLDSLRRPVTKISRKSGPFPYYGASGVVDYVADYIFDEPLVLVGEDGAKWRRGDISAFRISGKTWVNNHAHVLRPLGEFINSDYLVYSLIEMDLMPYITGMTVPKLNQTRLVSIAFALPPLEEQSRIVAKVDELMALCDQLEAQQQQRRSLQNKLRQSTLQAVAAATSPHELQTTWARLADNFGQLFDAPEDVDDFIANLKNMAVRGLLSFPSQVTAELDEIVAACNEMRAEYIVLGLMRRQKIVSHAETDVVYPSHWGIAPFDKVAIVIGGVTKGRNLRGRIVLTCPYLAVANVQRGFFKLHALKTIEIGAEELDKYLVKEGDLLVTEGGDWDKVGRTGIWRGGVQNCLHQNHIFKARVPSKALRNEWVELVFNSGVGQDYFAGASKQTTNLASINMTQLRGFPLPIPPYEEQQAILEKIDALTALCSVWREQLVRKQTMASLLAAATVASITGIATIIDEEAPLKAPQTELIAPLRLGQTPDIKAQAPLATILARHHGELAAKDLWQLFGGEIDAFYAQLKQEVGHGWIQQPEVAEMREKESA